MRKLLAACLLCVPFLVPEHGHAATPHVTKMAPPVVCNMSRRMDIFIDEDNILWECICEVMWAKFTCHWQVVAGVDAVNTRRWIKRHPHRIILYPRAVAL
jgi:hypothetical protein